MMQMVNDMLLEMSLLSNHLLILSLVACYTCRPLLRSTFSIRVLYDIAHRTLLIALLLLRSWLQLLEDDLGCRGLGSFCHGPFFR